MQDVEPVLPLRKQLKDVASTGYETRLFPEHLPAGFDSSRRKVGLFTAVMFSLVDKQKTGVLFRQKKIVVPVAFGSGAFGMIGMLIVYLSQRP